MKKYWFCLEPYVYVSLLGNSIFLYNTLDGRLLECRCPIVYDIISQMKHKPEGVLSLSQEQLEDDRLNSFIHQVRDYFMGDLIDASLSQGKPIQFTPMLNIQTDVDRMKMTIERSVGEDVILNLNELIFYIGSPSALPNKYYPSNLSLEWEQTIQSQYNYLESILKQIPPSITENMTIALVTKNLDELENKDVLVEILGMSKIKKIFHLYYKEGISEDIFNIGKISITLNIDFPFDDKKLNEINNLLKDKKEIDNLNYTFFISSLKDMEEAEAIIEKYEISEYTLIPYYTGLNYSFFKENIFLDKDDLLSEPVSMKKIFLHQSLNIESFGKLHIAPNGDVFSNLFSPKLGSIGQQTLLEMLHKEFDSTQSWLKVRNYAPCDKCHLQWLCPSPSSYESLLKKNNLCNINVSQVKT